MGISIGKIVGKQNDYRDNFYPVYRYTVANIEYSGTYSGSKSNSYWVDYEGKYFPVVYSTINPDKSILLISPDDFDRFGIVFPDSLNWVKDKLKF